MPSVRSQSLSVGRATLSRFCAISAFTSRPSYRRRVGRSLLWPMERRSRPSSNLPAVIIIAVVTLLLVIGIRESATVNHVIVFVKVAVVLVFIIGAAHAVNRANWQ